MIKKSLLTTHWSPEEAYRILHFIDEIRDVLLANYSDGIAGHYRQKQGQIGFDFKDDAIPFWMLAARALQQKNQKGESPFFSSVKN